MFQVPILESREVKMKYTKFWPRDIVLRKHSSFRLGNKTYTTAGYFSRRVPPVTHDKQAAGVLLPNVSPRIIEDEVEGISEALMNEIKAENIRAYHR